MRARPDGYTLLIFDSAHHFGNSALMPGLPWDPVKDFAAVALLTVATNSIFLGASPSAPAARMRKVPKKNWQPWMRLQTAVQWNFLMARRTSLAMPALSP